MVAESGAEADGREGGPQPTARVSLRVGGGGAAAATACALAPAAAALATTTTFWRPGPTSAATL